MQRLTKIFLVTLINMLLSIPTYAKALQQSEMKFKVSTEELMKGDLFYFFDVLTPRQLVERYPEFYDLDSLGFLQEPNVMVVVSKASYVVNKPSGFFDNEKMIDEKYIAHLMGEQKIKKLSQHAYKVMVPGEGSHSYTMKTFFDSDDMTTLPNSRVTQAVTAAKKLDIISQSSSSTVFREYSEYSKFGVGGVSFDSFIPLKEDKTIVINYKLMAVKKPFAQEKVLKTNIVNEIEAIRKLIEKFN
jgi:hypothetical protein